MCKYNKSTVDAINDAYKASGTWRRLADDLGVPDSYIVMMYDATRDRAAWSRARENDMRQVLGLPPLTRRRYWRPCLPASLTPDQRRQVLDYVEEMK